METGDPDDTFTLILLVCHSAVELRAVSVFPGGPEQIGFVRAILKYLGKDIPIGKCRESTTKTHLGRGLPMLFPEIKHQPEQADGVGHEILAKFVTQYPKGTVCTGGPLENVANFLKNHTELKIHRLVAQGGFAGTNCIPIEKQFGPFKGKTEIGTWNFNCNIPAATAVLQSDKIGQRFLVSKDVCHQVVYTAETNERLKSQTMEHIGWELMYNAMELFLSKKKGGGKKFHDPLAVAAAIDPEIITFLQVNTYYKPKVGWGSLPVEGTNTFISIAVDIPKFWSVFFDEPKKKQHANTTPLDNLTT